MSTLGPFGAGLTGRLFLAEELIVLALKTAVIELTALIGMTTKALFKILIGGYDVAGPVIKSCVDPAHISVKSLGGLLINKSLTVRGIGNYKAELFL